MALLQLHHRWGPNRLLVSAEQELPPHRLGCFRLGALTRAAVHVLLRPVSRLQAPLMIGHQVSVLLQYRRRGPPSCLPDGLTRLNHHAVLHMTLRDVPCRPHTLVQRYWITLVPTKCGMTPVSLWPLQRAHQTVVIHTTQAAINE